MLHPVFQFLHSLQPGARSAASERLLQEPRRMYRRSWLAGVSPAWTLLAGALSLSLFLHSSAARSADEERATIAQVYFQLIAADLATQARGVLRRIEDGPRQWLAARAYLRAGQSLPARWSWSAEQIEGYANSSEHRDLLAAVNTVRVRFETQNPGYSLYANTQTRSLDLQLERWNENASVATVARSLHRAVLRELASGAYPAEPTASATRRLATFLRTWRPPFAAPLAAPGLSMHGQLRAIDFQITHDGRIIAPTQISKVASVWERQGWARKLQQAAAQSSFVGPLRSPNEPWHYEYVSTVQQAAASAGAPASSSRNTGAGMP